MSKVTDLYYHEEDVGNKIKMTKQHHVWEFKINGTYHIIELFHSRTSGKKVLQVDGIVISEETQYKNIFEENFFIDDVEFNIIQTKSDKYDLRIGHKSFNILMIEEKNSLKQNNNNQNNFNNNNNNSNYYYSNDNNQIGFKNVQKSNSFQKIPSFLRTRSSSYSKSLNNNMNNQNFSKDTRNNINNNKEMDDIFNSNNNVISNLNIFKDFDIMNNNYNTNNNNYMSNTNNIEIKNYLKNGKILNNYSSSNNNFLSSLRG